MRMLVIGAGVIGSNLAADLFSSGRDVTLLARGEWADALEKNVACDITDHKWFDEIPFEKENGVVFLAAGVNAQIRMTKNTARMDFSMEDAEKELPAMSGKVSKVITKSYLEGYPVEGVRYSWLTKQYIKSKRDKYFVTHVEFER